MCGFRMAVILLAGVSLGAAAPAQVEAWRPVPGRLLSPFAAELDPGRPHPEYPRPQLVRERWKNLNGLWEFAVAAESDSPPIGRSLGGRILVPFPVESALSGQGKRAERVWYRRTFAVPADWAGARVQLRFGAVDWEAAVWVNGKHLGTHRGGFDAFAYDVTDALKPDGEQELVVGVRDPTDGGTQPRGKQVREPRGIWYTSTTGIWQTVWLEPVPLAHVQGLRVEPHASASKVVVTVEGSGAGPGHSVRLLVPAPGGGTPPATTGSGRVGEPIELRMKAPALWSPESPHLHDLEVELLEGERVVDRVTSYFGMRDIAVGKGKDGVTRILLNGRFVFQVGPLDQGFWPGGLYTAPNDRALRHDVETMKRLGFNMVRKHVKIEPDRWYYWCDRLGLLVWQDMPSGDAFVPRGKKEITRTEASARQFETELGRLLEGRRNHPSIVMWVVFNEGWGQYATERLAQDVKRLDPRRLVCAASGWHDLPGAGDVHDIHAYPGPRAPEPEAGRAAVLGEFGGLGLPIPGHLWQAERNWGYRNLKSGEELLAGYRGLAEKLRPLIARPGLSAAVYTQLTDVESEVNGLMTYDRAVLKVDAEALARIHDELRSPPPR